MQWYAQGNHANRAGQKIFFFNGNAEKKVMFGLLRKKQQQQLHIYNIYCFRYDGFSLFKKSAFN